MIPTMGFSDSDVRADQSLLLDYTYRGVDNVGRLAFVFESNLPASIFIANSSLIIVSQ